MLLHKLVNVIRSGKRSDNCFKIMLQNTIAQLVQAVMTGETPGTGANYESRVEGLRTKLNIWIRLKNLT